MGPLTRVCVAVAALLAAAGCSKPAAVAEDIRPVRTMVVAPAQPSIAVAGGNTIALRVAQPRQCGSYGDGRLTRPPDSERLSDLPASSVCSSGTNVK